MSIEAAAKTQFNQISQYEFGVDLWDTLSGEDKATRIERAKQIIAAYAGDRVLYEIIPDKEVDVDSFAAVDLHTGGLRWVVQVWPEVE